jgi:hypothetical protein
MIGCSHIEYKHAREGRMPLPDSPVSGALSRALSPLQWLAVSIKYKSAQNNASFKGFVKDF